MALSLRPLRAALVASVLTAAALPAQVYDNGGPNGASGNEMTGWMQAEDFTLADGATIGAVRFWALQAGQSYQGSIFWQVLANAGGTPGAAIASGLATPVGVSVGGGCCGIPQYQFDFEIAPLALGSGSYWLALHNGPTSVTSSQGFYWATTAANGTTLGMEDPAPFDGAYRTNGQEHAFALYGTQQVVTPEPATLALTATGLLAVGVVVRRRRTRA